MTNAIQATIKRQTAAKQAWKTIRKNATSTAISERYSDAAKKAWNTIRHTYSKRQLVIIRRKAVATRRRNAAIQFAQ